MKFKYHIGALVLAATAVTGFTATPALAGNRYDDGYRYSDYDDRDYRDYRYDRREARRDYRNNYRRCDKGTGGTVIGAVAGGLLGNEVARRGNKTEGTIIGAAVGALAGRAIDKADSNCKRRRYR
jgi:outer membrane lipoprotein SlyB